MTGAEFEVVDTPSLTSSHIATLASGMVAALRVPHMLTAEQCADTVAALTRLPASSDGHSTAALRTIGPALSEYRTAEGGFAADRYWPAAEAARLEWLQARVEPDVMAIVLGRIGTSWGEAVLPATIGGRPVFGPTVQQIDGGTPPHFDAIWRDGIQGLLDHDIVAQFSVGVTLEAPNAGGEQVVWRRQWEPRDENWRNDSSYGYESKIVEEADGVVIAPEAGTAVIINTAYCHALRPVSAGRRVALGMFLGLTVRGQLIAWS